MRRAGRHAWPTAGAAENDAEAHRQGKGGIVKLESLILTFAVNASWQLLALAVSARACRGLIERLSPRLQCRFWSAALLATVVIPAASASMAVSGHESALKTLQLR